MEHRWGDRIRADVAVKLLGQPASTGWGRLRNVSVSGAFIETLLDLSPLTTLQLTEVGSDRLALGAVVVRREPDGVGVEWLDSNLPTAAKIVQEAKAALGPMPERVRRAVWKPGPQGKVQREP